MSKKKYSKDIKGLELCCLGMDMVSDRMKRATVEFIYDKYVRHYVPNKPEANIDYLAERDKPIESDGIKPTAPEQTERNNQGLKNDSRKPDWTLLPWDALEEVVRVLDFGARKYARENWQKVEPHRERYGAALIRHYKAWITGQVNDPETGLNHMAHLICCALFLLWHEKRGQE